mmetsp:Transcript_28923/g.44976  ORF Transcript_28923/g.44976 Transcript_28923/m.44976 type:complete len:743 (-) Transcript_28923:120-2348(-)
MNHQKFTFHKNSNQTNRKNHMKWECCQLCDGNSGEGKHNNQSSLEQEDVSLRIAISQERVLKDAATLTSPVYNRSKTYQPPQHLLTRVSILMALVSPLIIAARDDSSIGDKVRSAQSSSSFFDWVLDTNRDGVVKKPEMANFIRNSIGGSAFDTETEVNFEVERIMGELDQNQDENLDLSDVFSHWKQLESVLTVDEVKDWVLYAVQLPGKVANTFVEHSVTGYDFPELIENDGDALRVELGIEKQSFRKKLLRSMHAKLLGIGSVPTTPPSFKHNLESCSAVNLTWRKPTAISFPVHSYRVQRRAVSQRRPTRNKLDFCEEKINEIDAVEDIFGEAGKCNTYLSEKEAHEQNDKVISKEYSASSADWVTVYIGVDTSFLDSNLEHDHKYVYRLQAWNSIGHSPWATRDISSSLKRSNCLTSVGKESLSFREEPLHFLLHLLMKFGHVANAAVFNWFTQLMSHVFQAFCTVVAVATALMRYRRATALSSAMPNAKPMFPWLWRTINDISVWVLGHEIIPKSFMDGTRTTHERRGAHNEHDIHIGAVNVDGYHRINGNVNGQLRRKISNRSSTSEFNHTRNRKYKDIARYHDEDTQQPARRRSSSFDGVGKQNSRKDKRRGGPRTFFRKSASSSFLTTGGSPVSSDNESKSFVGATNMSIVDSEISFDGHDHDCQTLVENWKDNQCCNVCGKRFRFGKRWRHHCARCLSAFCHKHGHTTHKNFLSCKVPGDCVCNKCLDVAMD